MAGLIGNTEASVKWAVKLRRCWPLAGTGSG